jgi:bifunctional non-homologous end joining protein LigD
MFFDCLGLEGYDLRGLPLVQRKELLTRVLPPLGMVQRCDHIVEHGDAFFEAAAKLGLEGIVAKQLQSKYAGRRTQDWVKVKCDRRDFFVIGGYTEPKGSRAQFGALHFGRYEGDQLVYVSKVGTGFDGAKLDEISKMLAPLKRATSPFTVATPTGKGHFWVEPKLVCEIRYTEWTHEGGLRHPTFMRMAPERKPEECRPEEILKIEAEDGAADESKIENGAGAEGAKRKSRKKASAKAASSSKGSAEKSAEASLSEISPSSASGPTATERFRAAASAEKIVRLSNLKKVFWPAEGYNKGDLISYYETVAPLLLPYLRNRPLVLTRYPDGIDGKSFFQKDAPVYVPDWIRTETIWSEDTKRDIKYFVVDDVESLRYVANMGTIPMHIWAAQVGSLENPDWLVIDLDPKEAPFVHVVQVARALKKILDELELPGYIKTSGKTGLHVLIPMGQQYSDDEVRAFARLIAMLTVESVPEISTVARMIKGRGGKVYVDFGQNGYGITIVAPYSLRPLPGAPASCPLRWDEVTARLDPANYTIQSLPKRFEKMDDPMVPVLGEGVDMASAIEKIQRRMESGS